MNSNGVMITEIGDCYLKKLSRKGGGIGVSGGCHVFVTCLSHKNIIELIHLCIRKLFVFDMPIPLSIKNNLKFFLIEVDAQVTALKDYCEAPSPSLAKRISERSRFAFNFKQRVQKGCMENVTEENVAKILPYQTVLSIASNLERISEQCCESVDLLMQLRPHHALLLTDYVPMLEKVSFGLTLIESAFMQADTQLAIKLGNVEVKLDKAYARLLKKYTQALKETTHTSDYVHGLFVVQLIEQMGDVLLEISEAIISTNMGQQMDFQRFESMHTTLTQWKDKPSRKVSLEAVAQTRSGSGISKVAFSKKGKQNVAIYKDGDKQKLKEEVHGINRWHDTYPEIAPQIITFQKEGNNASLLIEHLDGITFEYIVLNGSKTLVTQSMSVLSKQLSDIWKKTKRAQPFCAEFIKQMQKRLPKVYELHPEFNDRAHLICGKKIAGLQGLLVKAHAIEVKYPAPFSVFIHGDFNVDNILFDQHKKNIKFIDLHRSTYFDYVQDVSVFMVSNFRLQAIELSVRRRILLQVMKMYRFASMFAKSESDEYFELRLALGLARSFLTSTRFILDKQMAQAMNLRARYLLERVIAFEQQGNALADFTLPIEELFSESF